MHRAHARIEEGRPRYEADSETHARVVERLLAACRSADVSAFLAVLAPDVVIIGDGGDVTKAPRRAVHGRDTVARLLAGIVMRLPAGTFAGLEVFNGMLGIVSRIADEPISAMAVIVAGDLVTYLHVVANPAKLRSLAGGREVGIR